MEGPLGAAARSSWRAKRFGRRIFVEIHIAGAFPWRLRRGSWCVRAAAAPPASALPRPRLLVCRSPTGPLRPHARHRHLREPPWCALAVVVVVGRWWVGRQAQGCREGRGSRFLSLHASSTGDQAFQGKAQGADGLRGRGMEEAAGQALPIACRGMESRKGRRGTFLRRRHRPPVTWRRACPWRSAAGSGCHRPAPAHQHEP